MENLKIYKYAILSTALFISTALEAQKIEKLYEQAEKLFYNENLTDALYAYQQVLEENPSYEDADYKAEICSLLTDYREKPIDDMIAFGNTKGRNDKFYHYWMGRIYVREYMFSEAIASWRAFLNARTSKSRVIRAETADFIHNAKSMIDFFENTDNYEIHQLEGGINSQYAELSPVYSEETGELLFASAQNSSDGKEFKIYHTIKQDNGWNDLREISSLGTFERSHANMEVVNEDGKLFIFNKKRGGDIFYSEPKDGNWTSPVEFDSKVTKAHIKSHFFINEHEDRIIFVSDKNSKKNGTDLYQTFRDPSNGKWTKPAPFAEVINSEFDEESPYLSPDEKTLYFSSRGHGSIGGFDVFKSTFDSVRLEWSEPVNLGFPINSPDDEIHFKMNPDKKGGYFSSNRLHTKGDYDIYFFWKIEKIQIEGKAFDYITNAPIPDATIRFTPSAYTDEHFKSDLSADGDFSVEIISDESYLVEVIKNGEVLFTQEFEIHQSGSDNVYNKDFMFNKPQLKEAIVETASIASQDEKNTNDQPDILSEVQEDAPLDDNKSRDVLVANEIPVSEDDFKGHSEVSYEAGNKIIIQNIYFGFGTTSILRESNPVLDKLYQELAENTSIKIEIGGHTDNVGSQSSNLWISENRAKTVKKWLVDKGIDEDRIVTKGYGESYPLASNDDEKNGRELNRRIEVKVITSNL